MYKKFTQWRSKKEVNKFIGSRQRTQLIDASTFDEMNKLLKMGADPNAQDQDGITPLIEVYKGNNTEKQLLSQAKLLLDYGANPNLKGRYGWTPLQEACKNSAQNTNGIKLLLEHNADPNQSDRYGDTPLSHAIMFNKPLEAIKLLLDYGADPNKPDRFNWTPLAGAIINLNDNKKNVPTIKELIDYGADLSKATINGKPALSLVSDKKTRDEIEDYYNQKQQSRKQ